MTDCIYLKGGEGCTCSSIRAAIEAAIENDVYTVLIDGGVCDIKETIFLQDGVKIVLDGATLRWSGKEGGYIMANCNAFTDYAQVIAAEQKFISVCGKNGAKIDGGGILLRNVSGCIVENLSFEHCERGLSLASTMGVKVRNLKFDGCQNGIVAGCGASDIFFNDIRGEVENTLICLGDGNLSEMYKLYHPRATKNIIMRGINAKASKIVEISGNVEKIIVNDVTGEVSDVAFDFKTGKHLVANGVKVKGKIINDDVPENHVVMQ